MRTRPRDEWLTHLQAHDVPVRFDADRIETTLESFDAGRMAAVPLIEVRV